MVPVNSDKGIFQFFFCRVAMLLLIIAAASLCGSQEPAAQVRPPFKAILALPQVEVPNVIGQTPQAAAVKLREAGLVPGKTSTEVGPGTVGTVLRQDPPQYSVVVRGTTFDE